MTSIDELGTNTSRPIRYSDDEILAKFLREMHARLRISQKHGIEYRLRDRIGIASEKEVLSRWLDGAEERYEVGRDAIEETALEVFVLARLEVPTDAVPKCIANNCARWWRLEVFEPHVPGIVRPSLEIQILDNVCHNLVHGNRGRKRC